MTRIMKALTAGQTLVPMKHRSRYLVFFLVNFAMAIDKVNVTGAITSFYSLSQKFNASTATVSWVLSVYALTMGSFIVLFGKIGDIFGHHHTFVVGTFIMAIFSLLSAAVDESIYAVIVFRAFQGIAGAALIPSGFALAANYFQGHERIIALKILSSCSTGALGLGVVIGGAFDETKIGYQALFYFTFAVSFLSGVLLYFVIIPVEKTEGHKNLSFKHLDFFGVFLMTSALLLIIVGLTQAATTWNSPSVYVTIPVGLLFLTGFFLFETVYIKQFKKKFQDSLPHDEKTSQEKQDWRLNLQVLFPAELLKIPNFYQLFFGIFLVNASFVCLQTNLVEYYEYIEFQSSLMASIKILPLPAGTLAGSLLFTPKIIEKLTLRGSLIMVGVIGVVCSLWISRTDYTVHNYYWKFNFASQFLMGYVINMYFMVFLGGLMHNTPLHLQGVVSGFGQTVIQIGASVGTSLINSVIGNMDFEKGNETARHHVAQKFQKSLYLVTGMMGVLTIAMLFVSNQKNFINNGEKASQEEESVAIDNVSLDLESSIKKAEMV
ncbi:hypothetical protein DASC09_018450 [Saccharomycopsis crataegensis]|uniref:Major facilitator superfamily (MFS) profile domain-containing protein n=1 Tax=Saccharomycopsis crataegensis TaxID=43959 RepID=A0AAV5QJH2_9ASCO|nr:hypothetical protein DASC09_018450 [Saccharomycopsis crataegensis]